MLVDITMKVPEDAIPDIYSAVGQVLRSRQAQAQAPAQSPATNTASGNGLAAAAIQSPVTDWEVSDIKLVEQLIDASGKNARAIYRVLVDNAGQWVTPAQLDAAVGMTGYHRVGVLGSMGKSSHHLGRRRPWDWHAQNYRMPRDIAPLFEQALDRH